MWSRSLIQDVRLRYGTFVCERRYTCRKFINFRIDSSERKIRFVRIKVVDKECTVQKSLTVTITVKETYSYCEVLVPYVLIYVISSTLNPSPTFHYILDTEEKFLRNKNHFLSL